jgi:processive 1,2-diacylglycerol beta-glucosyltransferase
VACGQPIDPAFASLPDRLTFRTRHGVRNGVPLLLILFGGAGFGRPRQIITELKKLKKPFQAVLITGRNERLHREVLSLTKDNPAFSAYGWVNNMHEWMAASDLVITKPGASTLVESLSCGLPILALDPLPGNERRACDWIEARHFGYWVRKISDLLPLVERLLADKEELHDLHSHALSFARPNAAIQAARAILAL